MALDSQWISLPSRSKNSFWSFLKNPRLAGLATAALVAGARVLARVWCRFTGACCIRGRADSSSGAPTDSFTRTTLNLSSGSFPSFVSSTRTSTERCEFQSPTAGSQASFLVTLNTQRTSTATWEKSTWTYAWTRRSSFPKTNCCC